MASRKVNVYYAGIRELLQSAELARDLGRRAEHAESYARGIAPRGRTGEYGSSFYVRVTRTHGGIRNDRAAAYLGNTDPAAFQIEVGTSDTPAHRTLRRAATEAMGDA
jgi:hypothetical protein